MFAIVADRSARSVRLTSRGEAGVERGPVDAHEARGNSAVDEGAREVEGVDSSDRGEWIEQYP
jgi:hypothetical protein